MYAAGTGNDQNVEDLLLFGADPTEKDNFGNTALHYAAGRKSGYIPFLMPRTTGFQERSSGTPVPWNADYATCIRILCEKTPDLINMQADDGDTALHRAISFPDIVRELQYFSPNLTLRNKEGQTALDVAVKYSWEQSIAILTAPIGDQRLPTRPTKIWELEAGFQASATCYDPQTGEIDAHIYLVPPQELPELPTGYTWSKITPYLMPPDETIELLDEILEPYDSHAFQWLNRCEAFFEGSDKLPWAIIALDEEQPLAAHTAEIRRFDSDPIFSSYKPKQSADSDIPPENISHFFFMKKETLANFANQSPLFEEAWRHLKDADESSHWLCIIGNEDVGWLWDLQDALLENQSRQLEKLGWLGYFSPPKPNYVQWKCERNALMDRRRSLVHEPPT